MREEYSQAGSMASCVRAARRRLLALVGARPTVADARGTLRNLDFADDILVVAADSRAARRFREAGASRVIQIAGPVPPDGGAFRWPEEVREIAHRESLDWVLCVDADERVPPSLRAELIDFLASPSALAGGGDAPLVTVTRYRCGRYLRHGGWRGREARMLRAPAEGSSYPPAGARAGGSAGGGSTFRHVLVELGYRELGAGLRRALWASDPRPGESPAGGGGVGYGRIVLEPIRRFLEISVLRRGLLDGTCGIVAASLEACESFLRLARRWERAHVVAAGDRGATPGGETGGLPGRENVADGT